MATVSTDITQTDIAQWEAIAHLCKQSPTGKHLPNALYVHQSALQALEPTLQNYEQLARCQLDPQQPFTLVKFQCDRPKISYLLYPDFDTDPHPALQLSIQVDLTTLEVIHRDYRNTHNPPVLHRKETFVTPGYSLYPTFAALTQQEESLGLLDHSRYIGTYLGWQQRLNEHQIELHDHFLACPRSRPAASPPPQIDRHKAALVRTSLSKPVRLALEADLFSAGTTFFDYGCGHGSDIQYIATQGYTSSGWDPYYCPHHPVIAADIVNLGYIINVIESPIERRDVLLNAWNLTQKILIVAAQVLIEDRFQGSMIYGDGVITRRNTFQKYYEQEELKAYIDQVLGAEAIPVALSR